MKANYSKSQITVTTRNNVLTYFPTDVYNISYVLAGLIDAQKYYSNLRNIFFSVMSRQKSIRAVVQKFNSICKSLELE